MSVFPNKLMHGCVSGKVILNCHSIYQNLLLARPVTVGDGLI